MFDLLMQGAGMLGGVAGTILDYKAAEKDRIAQKDQAALNIAMQKEFAQHGLRWKVEDAKAAGISPLYALGAQGASFSPISVGDPGGGDGYRAVGQGLRNMGQDISRAVSATKTSVEKERDALTIAGAKAEVEGKHLDNQIKAKQLQNLSVAAPSFPGGDQSNFIPGQGNSNVLVKPAERTSSQKGRLAQEAGWTPDVAYARTDTGLVPVPSKDVKERIEDQFIPETMWAIRNQFTPNWSDASAPAKSQLPKGATHWKWSYTDQEWQPGYGEKKHRGRQIIEHFFGKPKGW